ncbi:hypothetical protein Hanom_Chr13g01199101 [Helianthus anomalus]
MNGSCSLHLVTHFVHSFLQKYIDGPCGLHFLTHLVLNLDLLKVQTTGTIRVLL